MRLLILLAIFLLAIGVHAQRLMVIQDGLGTGVPKNYFQECVQPLNYDALFATHISKDDTVRIVLEAGVYDSSQCEGISYYRYWSRSVRQPSQFRGKDGRMYQLFYLFIVLDGKLYAISQMSEEHRKNFLQSNRKSLRQKFSKKRMDELESEILSGSARFY